MNYSPSIDPVVTYHPVRAATVYRPARPEPEQTICVLGVPRGGTSMVAGVLAQFGIPMGAPADDPNQEDHAFLAHQGIRDIFTARSRVSERDQFLAHARATVATRNAAMSVWGWKDPISSHYIRDLHPTLRNPHYVVVTRDPAAVATREVAHDPSSDPHLLTLHTRTVLAEYTAINDFIENTDAPVLVVSYERALHKPEEFIRDLHAFIDPDEPLSETTLLRIVDYIQPSRGTGQIVLTEEEQAALDASLSHDRRGRHAADTSARHIEVGSVTELALASVSAPEVNLSGVHGPASQTLFSAAAEHLMCNLLPAADGLAARALLALTDQAPVVASGPAACAHAAHEADQRTLTAADVIVGCFNIRGLVALRRGDAEAALAWFANGYQVASAALCVHPTRHPVCDDLVWWMAFHAAVAAKASGRADWADHVAEIGAHPFNPASAQLMSQRAATELAPDPVPAHG